MGTNPTTQSRDSSRSWRRRPRSSSCTSDPTLTHQLSRHCLPPTKSTSLRSVTWTPTRNISITPSVARTASLHHRCPTHLDFNLQPPPPPPPPTTKPPPVVVVVVVIVEQTHARTIFIFKMFNLFSVFSPLFPIWNCHIHIHTHTHACTRKLKPLYSEINEIIPAK